MKTYELEFPLKHPKHVLINTSYYKKVTKIMGIGHPWLRFFRRMSYIFRCIIHGEAGRLFKAFGRKIKRNKK